ncbi:MAG: AAA family ATPase [Gaiellales bacterium]|jgi:adenylylsulfate kinase-like enzyme|nr:AAA family ATPase [Gaiellales bacterium]
MTVPVLLLTGPSGVGKTTVAYEVSAMLAARDVAHALIDTDNLDHIHPPPADDPTKGRLTAANLAAVWANLSRAGARRLILTGVVEDLEAELRLLGPAVPEGQWTVVLLRASYEERARRLAGRESGSGLEYHLARTRIVAERLERRTHGRLVVDTDGLSVEQVAAAVLEAAGWGGGPAQPPP